MSGSGAKNQSIQHGHGAAVLVTVIVTSLATTFSGSALNLAIPSIGIEFGSRATLVGWLVTGYILCTAMFSVPFGRIADITGRRRIFIIGIAVFSAASGAAFFAQSIGTILALRVTQGLGGAMIFSTNTAILVDAFPAEMRGKVLGYSVASVYAGLSVGPVIGGLLTHYFGWRSVFAVTAAVSIPALAVAISRLPKPQTSMNIGDGDAGTDDRKGSFNPVGICMYIAMVFCVMYGFSVISANPYAWILIVAGIAQFPIFAYHELHTKKPLIEIRLFARNPNFLLSNLASLFNYGANFAVGYLLSIYLQLVMGFGAQISGIILICQPVMQAILSPLAGRLSDKYSPFKLASIGMACCAGSLFSYVFLGLDAPLFHVLINLTATGVGFGLFSSPNTNAVMSAVSPADYSVASSILATMRSLGHVSSMAVITLIMHMHLGDASFESSSPEMLMDTMRTAFIVFSAVCAVGVFISLQRKRGEPA
ncbi:MAG: MFS transporter [Clostridiales Family XIII bacterium]|nr:MFS transporter [Clostridiales Family XIII bacterium]